MPNIALTLLRPHRLSGGGSRPGHWGPCAPICALLLSLALSACGGGGGGGDAGSGAGGGTVAFANAPTLSGVAAVAAPLTGAQVKVVDGSGAAVGSGTTAASDGSYSLTLSSKTLTAPLLVQVRGLDAAGMPQVLHSAVPVMSAASAAMVANVTPLSDAIVALSMGGDPKPVFAAADQNKAVIAQVATAASAAGSFVKTLIAKPLTDLKFSNPLALDLLGDPSFAANKSAQDLLLESLRVDVAKSSKGVAQLSLSNKLLIDSTPEVLVDLSAAQTELLKTEQATPANAISSVLKATTSPTATLANMGSLDEFGAALNQLMVQTQSATTIAAHTLLAGYVQHNGRQKAELAALLAGYATRGLQLGRVQVNGCADDSLTAGQCVKLSFTALLTDASGAVAAVLSDALSFNKASTTGSKWNVVGNGRKLDLAVQPMAYLALESTGALSSSQTPNPSMGLLFEFQAQKPGSGDEAPTQLLESATVQAPGGFSLGFAYCAQPLLCLAKTPGAVSQVASGDISDTAVQKAKVAWMGPSDSLRGARFLVSSTGGGSTETRTVSLRSDVLAEVAQARFPVLNGVSADKPLTYASLKSELALDWTLWAAANPDLRLIKVQTVVIGGASPLMVQTVPPASGKTSMALAALSLPSDLVPTRAEIWLHAQDAAGRRYITRYSLAL